MSYGTPGPYEDAVQGQPIFEENDLEHFKGIDVMRTVRSFDPCLPCGVHMYLGGGKKLEVLQSPTQSLTGEWMHCTARASGQNADFDKLSPSLESMGKGGDPLESPEILKNLSETGERIDSLLSALGTRGRWPSSAVRT